MKVGNNVKPVRKVALGLDFEGRRAARLRKQLVPPLKLLAPSTDKVKARVEFGVEDFYFKGQLPILCKLMAIIIPDPEAPFVADYGRRGWPAVLFLEDGIFR